MNKITFSHYQNMYLALALAKKAPFSTLPNPRVGCVIAKDGMIVATGYHKIYGGLHAEAEALQNLQAQLVGCDMYLTLEPCTGSWKNKKQLPCAEKIVASGQIARVFVISRDINPRIAGKGLNYLKSNGIIVIELSELSKEETDMNKDYRVIVNKNRPFIHAKIAQTLNGLMTRDSKKEWISSEKSRKLVQQMRSAASALMSTARTIAIDNPLYTVKNEAISPPLVIVDRTLSVPQDAYCLKQTRRKPYVLLFCDEHYYKSKQQKRELLEDQYSLKCVALKTTNNDKFDLHTLCVVLKEHALYNLLVEAGPQFTQALLQAGVCDRLTSFIAPIFWGTNAPANSILNLDKNFSLTNFMTFDKNDDVILQGDL